jgi:limonene-1,2-epoxide hydrolase
MMTPKDVVRAWVVAFNAGDLIALEQLYGEDAINHQVAYGPIAGREAIMTMLRMDFARATMVCVPEALFEDGEWAILEWSDPLGMRGCGFFHVIDRQIVHQRGYFDRLAFYAAQGIGLDDAARAEAALVAARQV